MNRVKELVTNTQTRTFIEQYVITHGLDGEVDAADLLDNLKLETLSERQSFGQHLKRMFPDMQVKKRSFAGQIVRMYVFKLGIGHE